MRASQAFLTAAAIVFSLAPQFAEAGPCSSDIAELETAIQQPGIKLPSGPGRQSVTPHPTPELARRPDERLQSQLSATVARATRLDMKGERIGCFGALNAARRMYVLVDTE